MPAELVPHFESIQDSAYSWDELGVVEDGIAVDDVSECLVVDDDLYALCVD